VILEDSFNSNTEVFKNALDVLSKFNKFKILITPGIVEGGKEESKINLGLAEKISAVCDLVILIKTKASLSIKKGLDEHSYQDVKVVEDFRKAIKFVKENYPDAAVLIENDITDIYKI
jgi:UDP-N-acetylmuramoyl-tripeptide--D-alanyl-D-alanine ligase